MRPYRPLFPLLTCFAVAALRFAAAETPQAPMPERLGSSAVLEKPAPAPPTEAVAVGKPAERLREGTRLIEAAGAFQGVGDRVVFSPQGSKDSYRILENLALQRIAQSLEEGGRSQRQCVVSGVLTEFRGANYLLISKYVLVNKAPGSGQETE